MPRFASHALDVLESWSADPDERSATEPATRALTDYLRAWGLGWHLGIERPRPLRLRVRALWSTRPELRVALAPVVAGTPCDEFVRLARRRVEQDEYVDLVAWLKHYPELRAEIRPAVLERARRFRQSFVALRACLIWARHLDGGDEAWRQAACVIKADEKVRARHPRPSGVFRHDLEDHGTVAPDEARQINRFLEQLGATLLEVPPLGRHWQFNDDVSWRHDDNRGRLLARVASASISFAAQHGFVWTPEDEQFYAERLRALNAEAARGFAPTNETLRKIVRRAFPEA